MAIDTYSKHRLPTRRLDGTFTVTNMSFKYLLAHNIKGALK